MSKTSVEKPGSVPLNGRKILMVSREGVFTDALTDHCIHLAERLKYDLVGLSIDTRLDGRSFEALASESAKCVRVEARKRGVRFGHIIRAGDLGAWLEEIIREIKRVELAVVDIEADSAEIRGISVPVVSVISSSNRKGGRGMAVQAGSSKVKAAVQMAGCGALSAAAYAAVFTNTETVMQLFTRGGWYASLPIATVLAISFVYGAFASSLWSLLGIEAHKRDHVRQTERKVIEKRKQLRKRPRLYAYINPFHRIDM